MSQEKIRGIIKKDIMIHGDNCYCNFCIPGGELDQASAKINKIVMECLPIEHDTRPEITEWPWLFYKNRDEANGRNKAIAEFKANCGGKMTIEEKVRRNLASYLNNCKDIYEEFTWQDDIDRNLELAQAEATQAILALIKPMSKEKLSDIILKKLVYAPGLSCDIADAILTEWGKE